MDRRVTRSMTSTKSEGRSPPLLQQQVQNVQSFTIEQSGTRVVVGDCVLIEAPEGEPPYIGRVKGIEKSLCGSDHKTVVNLQWFYHPEETTTGRLPFHGAGELYRSYHCQSLEVAQVLDKCFVHSFKKYTALSTAGMKDYFWRFYYDAVRGTTTPDMVPVYCACEMPWNPDGLMVFCESCRDWFHPHCVNTTAEQIKAMGVEAYTCPACKAS